MEKLLTSGEVAEICQVSVPTVLNWIKQGLLKSYHTGGGHNRFIAQDIINFLDNNDMYLPDDLRRKLVDGFYGKTESLRILVADDNDRIRETLIDSLKLEGNKVFKAADSLKTKSMIKDKSFEIIVLDYMMPGIYMPEIISLLTDKQTRIVVLLDYRDPAAENELSALGVKDVLVKPIDINDFINIVLINTGMVGFP